MGLNKVFISSSEVPTPKAKSKGSNLAPVTLKIAKRGGGWRILKELIHIKIDKNVAYINPLGKRRLIFQNRRETMQYMHLSREGREV